jgi:hypothetical protein
MHRYGLYLAVAILVVAAAGLGRPAPAQAASCGSATGVSVVVDFHQLGGGVATFCDSSGAGKTADAQLRDAGRSLTYVQRQPGFICRIDGKPADDPCVNTPPENAYWSLWWSDGKSGKWAYSSQGSASLRVPEGGYVAMSWQGQDAKAPPGLTPAAHVTPSSPSPSRHPSSAPGPSGSPAQLGPSSSAPVDHATSSTGAAPGPSRRHADGHHKSKARHSSNRARDAASKGASRGDGQAAGPLDRVTPASDTVDDSASGGLPWWVAPVAIALLFVGTGTVLLTRRRSSGGG